MSLPTIGTHLILHLRILMAEPSLFFFKKRNFGRIIFSISYKMIQTLISKALFKIFFFQKPRFCSSNPLQFLMFFFSCLDGQGLLPVFSSNATQKNRVL